ncbi:hypothetical protein LMF32_12020 [Desemzia sp. C1]|uniref:hypothetical protein n=1 Tax=Desemzia sp. C1 TaxID=2892016 RepID=UPI001E50D80B|nr:hypothetical protein [Desemzia sp. C1]MCI3029771.1 hypothetical protein [Desemzia sp. C1]
MEKQTEQLINDIYQLQGLMVAMEDAWENITASDDPTVQRYARPLGAIIQLAQEKANNSFEIASNMKED